MTTELMNKIIKYMMGRPYSEVYVLMDEIREEIKKEEVVDGSIDAEHSRDE